MTDTHQLARRMPQLLLFVSIFATGLLMWGRIRETLLPPGPEALSYQQKAKHVWDDLRSGFQRNPFSLAPTHRPP